MTGSVTKSIFLGRREAVRESQGDAESWPIIGELNGDPVQFRDGGDESQPETAPCSGTACFQPIEAPEDLCASICGDARSVI